MKAIFKFSFFLLITIVILSCQRDEEEPVPIIQACEYDDSIEELKAWHYFKQGTWWVYRDENSGDVDTIGVYHSGDGVSENNWPFFYWYAQSSATDFEYRYRFSESYSRNCNDTHDCMCHKVDRSTITSNDFIGSDWCFSYPNVPGIYITNGWYGRSTLVEIFPLYEISNFGFDEVIHWKSDEHPSENYQVVEFYIAKNIGIIRRILPEQNRDWVLIDYYIQK